MADKLRNTVYDLKYCTSLKKARVRGRNVEHQNHVPSSQLENNCVYEFGSRSQWPRGLRRSRSTAARLLRSWVRIPPGAWMFVCCECCVLSGRGLCDGLITRPEGSYRTWCVVVCDLETSRMRRPWPVLGRSATGKNVSLVKLSTAILQL